MAPQQCDLVKSRVEELNLNACIFAQKEDCGFSPPSFPLETYYKYGGMITPTNNSFHVHMGM